MSCFANCDCARCSAIVTLIIAVFIGLIVAGVPTYLGFYRWLAHGSSKSRLYFGAAPSFMLPEDYRYSFEQVARVDLTGQTAVVTGANSGVGYWSSLHLARQGASVIMACRNPRKCEKAADKIRANFSTADVTTLTIDTSKMKIVRQFATECIEALGERPLDMLFLNAGIGTAGVVDGKLPKSEDGIEMVFATNHVGHHLLYNLLEPLLKNSPMARVVLTSSAANFEAPKYGVATDLSTLNTMETQEDFDEMHPYGQSKLAQVLFAQQLTRRLPADSNIYVNAFHPGAVDTAIWSKMSFPFPFDWFVEKIQKGFMWTGEDGSLTMLYLGIETEVIKTQNIRGQYFHPQAVPIKPNDITSDPALGQAVWEFTESLFV